MVHLLNVRNAWPKQFHETVHNSFFKPAFLKILIYCRLQKKKKNKKTNYQVHGARKQKAILLVTEKAEHKEGVAQTNDAACGAETSTDKAQLLHFAMRD